MDERGIRDPFDFEDRMAHGADDAAEGAAPAHNEDAGKHGKDDIGGAIPAEDDPEPDAELQAMIDHDLAILEAEWAEQDALRDMERHGDEHCPFCAMMGKKSEMSGFVGGIFDDEGNRIDPASIPTPGMCILCRTYDTDSWGEEILCLLTRCDALHGEEEFRCANFSPKFGGRLP